MTEAAADAVHAIVAEALVFWPERAIAAVHAFDDNTETLPALTPGGEGRSLHDQLAARLRDRRKDWALEDIDSAIDSFRRRARTLPVEGLHGWIGVLRAALGIQKAYGGGIETGSRRWRGWAYAGAGLDIDSLYSHALAETRPTARDLERHDWGAHHPLRRPDINEIIRRGVTDMHVHLRGARTAQIVWLRLLLEAPHAVGFAKLRDLSAGHKLAAAFLRPRGPVASDVDGLEGDAASFCERLRDSLPQRDGDATALMAAERRALVAILCDRTDIFSESMRVFDR